MMVIAQPGSENGLDSAPSAPLPPILGEPDAFPLSNVFLMQGGYSGQGEYN